MRNTFLSILAGLLLLGAPGAAAAGSCQSANGCAMLEHDATANAKKAVVQLKETNTQLEVNVNDDGRGFDIAAPRHGGLGLIGIEDRVRELGGELQITSEPGKGSHLTVRFPLAKGTPA